MRTLYPREGYAYVACLTCSFVTSVPLDRTDPLPWCTHTGSYTWRAPEKPARKSAWTQMVRAHVEVPRFPGGVQ